jgi:hypothetical protein
LKRRRPAGSSTYKRFVRITTAGNQEPVAASTSGRFCRSLKIRRNAGSPMCCTFIRRSRHSSEDQDIHQKIKTFIRRSRHSSEDQEGVPANGPAGSVFLSPLSIKIGWNLITRKK